MKSTFLAFGCLLWAAGALSAQNPTISGGRPGFGSGATLCPGDMAQINGTNMGNTISVTVGGKTAFVNIQPGTAGSFASIQIPFEAGLGPQTVGLTSAH